MATPRDKKVDRWRLAVREACKQCRRAWLMEVTGPVAVEALVGNPRRLLGPTPDACGGALLVADPTGSVAAERRDGARSWAAAAIGPEGGWTSEELEALERAGFERWRLARHVLRIETACAAAACLLGR